MVEKPRCLIYVKQMFLWRLLFYGGIHQLLCILQVKGERQLSRKACGKRSWILIQCIVSKTLLHWQLRELGLGPSDGSAGLLMSRHCSGVWLRWPHPAPPSCLFITGYFEFHSTFLTDTVSVRGFPRCSLRAALQLRFLFVRALSSVSVCVYTTSVNLISSHNRYQDKFWVISWYLRFELNQNIMIHWKLVLFVCLVFFILNNKSYNKFP